MGVLTKFDGGGDTPQTEETKLDPAYDAPDGPAEAKQEEPPKEEEKKGEEKPGAKEEPPPKEEEKGKKSEWVPYKRLEAVSRRNQELSQKNEELSQKIEVLGKQFGDLKTALEAPDVPDEKEDPEAYRAWQLNQLKDEVKSLKGAREKDQETQTMTGKQQQMLNNYRASATRFAEENPDFNEAYGHMMQRRASGLRELGFSDQEIQNQVFNEEMSVVSRVIAQGGDPAEAIYKLAHGTYGYSKQGPKPKAPKSIAGGGSTTKDLTEKSVDDMTESEFNEFVAQQRIRQSPLRP